MKYETWQMKEQPPAEVLRSLRRSGIPALCALTLASRGIRDAQQAAQFLDGGQDASILHDPFLMLDMDRAVARLADAIDARETVAVYGDYDVDGITSTCLLTELLNAFGCTVASYIPDRNEEGYGLNKDAIRRLKGRQATLIVTVDCGITAMEEVEYANSIGMDVIITDHHRCREELPNALAVVDPRRPGDPYPFKELAGVGVAMKLAMALTDPKDRPELLRRFGELVAVGTVADVMKLTDENRFLVRHGLELLKQTRRPGLRYLLRETGCLEGPINETTIGFSLAPRLNAAGRMGRAGTALELLLTRIPSRGEQLTNLLCQMNRDRQTAEQEIYESCERMLELEPSLMRSALVISGSDWHQGVVGIVASRLLERYTRPVFMISLEGKTGKGSARSCGGFNLFAALDKCSDLLVEFGGHEMAAGFTILKENIEAFRDRVCSLVEEYTHGEPMEIPLTVDAEIIDCNILSLHEVEQLARMEPFGNGNPKPVFLLSSASVVTNTDVGSGRHMKLRLRRDGAVLDAIFFSKSSKDCRVKTGDRLDIVFTPQVNEFRGERSVQLVITDLRHAASRAKLEEDIMQRLMAGQYISRWEAGVVLPERTDFAWVWRTLERICSASPVPADANFFQTVSRNAAGRYNYGRTIVCLHVFKDVGLLAVEGEDSAPTVRTVRLQEKANLEQAALMRQLRSCMEGTATIHVERIC